MADEKKNNSRNFESVRESYPGGMDAVSSKAIADYLWGEKGEYEKAAGRAWDHGPLDASSVAFHEAGGGIPGILAAFDQLSRTTDFIPGKAILGAGIGPIVHVVTRGPGRRGKYDDLPLFKATGGREVKEYISPLSEKERELLLDSRNSTEFVDRLEPLMDKYPWQFKKDMREPKNVTELILGKKNNIRREDYESDTAFKFARHQREMDDFWNPEFAEWEGYMAGDLGELAFKARNKHGWSGLFTSRDFDRLGKNPNHKWLAQHANMNIQARIDALNRSKASKQGWANKKAREEHHARETGEGLPGDVSKKIE